MPGRFRVSTCSTTMDAAMIIPTIQCVRATNAIGFGGRRMAWVSRNSVIRLGTGTSLRNQTAELGLSDRCELNNSWERERVDLHSRSAVDRTLHLAWTPAHYSSC